jgi:hypothetical protein
MKTTLALATALLALAIAGSADAHWLVEQDTPLGPVCIYEDKEFPRGLREQDVDRMLHALAEFPCHEEH